MGIAECLSVLGRNHLTSSSAPPEQAPTAHSGQPCPYVLSADLVGQAACDLFMRSGSVPDIECADGKNPEMGRVGCL